MKLEVRSIRIVDNPETKRKAYASVVIDDSIILNDIVVVECKNGLFASMPQRKFSEGGEDRFYNTYTPITKEARDKLVKTVLDAYYEELEKM